MGLTKSSVGMGASAEAELFEIDDEVKVYALAGNPNVGKSTVFNLLTGLRQHTGNWAGKTVSNAAGRCESEKYSYLLVDIPGTYSLMAHSAEEKVARDFICFGKSSGTIIVCDATCLERNMNLVLQTMETGKKLLICINLMDEAKRKGIKIDTELLSKRLNAPVIGISAREKRSRGKLLSALDAMTESKKPTEKITVTYPDEIEKAVSRLEPLAEKQCGEKLDSRWLCLKLLEGDESLEDGVDDFLNGGLSENGELLCAAERERSKLASSGMDENAFKDAIVSALVKKSEEICSGAVIFQKEKYSEGDRKIDKAVTGKALGYPLMLLLLALIFYITLKGANYPSALLSKWLFSLRDHLRNGLVYLGAPLWLVGILTDGAYRVLAWVVSVMLPPMAIFFPLFTLLEDSGYLPRIAYNLDKPFKCCKACGKQALTMCMGFGCNAAGVVGCRIIDSERERLLAILTNSLVPCNGRFPMLITLLTLFCAARSTNSALLSALMLTGIIVLAVAITFAVTKLLSETVLKGVPSSFVLELPPYRRPQIGRVIVQSVLDRTLYVLGRAAAVAAPAGALLWLAGNIYIGDASLLTKCAAFLDPAGRIFGLDGAILIAFILAFPANEIVLPIIIMVYTAQGSITELAELSQLKEILLQNGWSTVTAVCVMLFSLMHWPCSTTLLTVRKETGELKWTLLAALIPTLAGLVCCFAVSSAAKLLGI